MITAKGKKSTKLITGAISQSKDRTLVFAVSGENNRVMQINKTNKSGKFNQNASDNIMAANSRISRVYVQANYDKDKKF